MAGPVLGVHGVVLNGGVEPQPVALLAVVEGGFEGRGGGAAASPRTPAASAPAAGGSLLLVSLVLLLLLLLLLLLGRSPRLSGLELGRDQGVVFSSQVDLVVKVTGRDDPFGIVRGRESLLLLEGLDLLNGHLKLMCDPRIGPALPHPRADLVELGA